MVQLNTKIEQLTRVGKTIANRFKKLGLETVRDLIFYFPFRYDDFSQIFSIDNLEPGMVATIKGRIELISNKRSPIKKKIITEAVISDGKNSIRVVWFNQPFLTKTLKPGDEIFLSGKINFSYHQVEFINPVYEKTSGANIHTARLVPIYSTTGNITQRQIRFLIKQSLSALNQITEWLPKEVINNLDLPNLDWSLNQIHFPDDNKSLKKAVRRVKFDELFLLQLRILLSKHEFLRNKAPNILFNEALTKKFIKSLPFELTVDQKKAAWQILQDMDGKQPMNRLVEGEVGSGKTVVVAIAVLNVFKSNQQTIFMAPTEILASQHYKTFLNFFKNFGLNIGILTRSVSSINGKEINKKELIKKIKSGQVDLIIGTHALIQDKVEFGRLGLAVIDEQHRFGVEQRKILKEKSNQKGFTSHFLTLSATPIPRSLSLIFYGDLNLSKILELPKGRKQIITKIITPNKRQEIYDFVKQEVVRGRQIFVICPQIDPSDKLGVKSVKSEFEKLNNEIFPDLNIDFLHGKMKPAEKETKMKNFLNNKINIMVATSVIEVGVDAPNVTVMVIEGAERFGLSQLYQFRGRVGRADHQSYCFLFSDCNSEKTISRLQTLVNAKNCFELAERDLEFRGPGEMFGNAQSGFSELKVATLQDYDLAASAKSWAEKLFKTDKNFNHYPPLKAKIKKELVLAHFE